MAPANCRKKWVGPVAVALAAVFLFSGCSGLRYHNLFGAALVGAGVGGIVGHQSDECANGVAVGAAVFFTGELLRQIDDLKEEEVEEAAEEVAKGNHLLAPAYLEQ